MRYKTSQYITMSEDAAKRLSAVDKTPWEKVKIEDAVPVKWWYLGTYIVPVIIWSDGKITYSNGIQPEQLTDIPRLSDAAGTFLSNLLGADTYSVEGGAHTLLNIASIERSHKIQIFRRTGGYAGMIVMAMRITMEGGARYTLWQITDGYFEGYLMELFWNKQSVRTRLKTENS